jgi:hypothetical protein
MTQFYSATGQVMNNKDENSKASKVYYSTLESGKKFAGFQLSVSDYVGKDAEGKNKYNMVVIDCQLFDKQAEKLAKLDGQGILPHKQQIMIQGKLNTYMKDNRRVTSVRVDNFAISHNEIAEFTANKLAADNPVSEDNVAGNDFGGFPEE